MRCSVARVRGSFPPQEPFRRAGVSWNMSRGLHQGLVPETHNTEDSATP